MGGQHSLASTLGVLSAEECGRWAERASQGWGCSTQPLSQTPGCAGRGRFLSWPVWGFPG